MLDNTKLGAKGERVVVGYYQILRPDAIEEHTATLCRFLEAGVNVVSTLTLTTT